MGIAEFVGEGDMAGMEDMVDNSRVSPIVVAVTEAVVVMPVIEVILRHFDSQLPVEMGSVAVVGTAGTGDTEGAGREGNLCSD